MFINLTAKDSGVVAQNGAWKWILNGGFGKLQYKSGPKGMFVFNAAKMAPDTGYALISYKEPWPGTGSTILGTGRSDPGGNVSISGKTDVPAGFVCNRYPTPTSREYQVNGTKIWLVLTSDLDMPVWAGVTGSGFATTQFMAWHDAAYLFETDLVNKGCMAPEEPICNDLDPCTTDSYDAGTKMCRHVRISCDDGNAFTTDTCNSGTGVCMHTSCDSGYADCDGNPADGCETSTGTDTANCGACGTVCSYPNAGASCISGSCTMGSCNTGWGDCPLPPGSSVGNGASDGCETDLTTITNCGSCGNTCDSTHGSPSCSGGSCGITCDTGYGDCTASAGCETNTGTDTGNCGGCGNTCPGDPNGSPTCSAGTCGLDCNTGWDPCGGVSGSLGEFVQGSPVGACVDLQTDTRNCGGCGNVCSVNHATPSCTAGACTIGECESGYEDCDGNVSNGCEANLASTDTCGSCVNACTIDDYTVQTCSGGTCILYDCTSGYADCNTDAACETDITTTTDCGECFNTCPTDPNGSPTCSAEGECGIDCDSGYILCSGPSGSLADSGPSITVGGCVDTSTDELNCGACGNTCESTNGSPSCISGFCLIECESGYGNCTAEPGCETDITKDMDCGACGNVCGYDETCTEDAGSGTWSCVNPT